MRVDSIRSSWHVCGKPCANAKFKSGHYRLSPSSSLHVPIGHRHEAVKRGLFFVGDGSLFRQHHAIGQPHHAFDLGILVREALGLHDVREAQFYGLLVVPENELVFAVDVFCGCVCLRFCRNS